jgi:hypothetical protein
VPLDPLLANEFSRSRAKQADDDVGTGRGRPPHHLFGMHGIGKTKWWTLAQRGPISGQPKRRHSNYDNIFVMFRAPVGKFPALAALLISAIPVSAQRSVVHEKEIVKAICDQFDKSDLVGLGEFHGSQADQDLRFQIIHSKVFARKVHIIVVEGLNALYQEDLDRYVRGEDLPLAQVQRVWRDSTGIFVGPVILTIYQQFLGEVRSVNRGLPDRLKLRVIAADPPLDWAKVQSPADFRSILVTRGEFGAEVIEREAIRKRQKALLVFATAWLTRNKQHMTANGLVPWTDTIGARLDRDYPGRLYVIAPVRSGEYPDTAKLERLIGMPPSPVLLRLHGSAFGTLDPNEFITANSAVLLGAPAPPFRFYRDGTTMAEVADAVVYRGKVVDGVARPDPSYAADTAYAAELKRRAGFAPAPPPGSQGGR